MCIKPLGRAHELKTKQNIDLESNKSLRSGSLPDGIKLARP